MEQMTFATSGRPEPYVDCPLSGVYTDVPFEEYVKWVAVNSGVVKCGITPKHFHAAMHGDIESDDTADRKLGRAIHCILLEPETFESRFSISRTCSALLKTGERKGMPCGASGSVVDDDGNWFCGKHKPDESDAVDAGEVITQSEYDRCLAIRDALKSHPAMTLLRRKGWSECSVVWDYAGLKMKGRLDRFCPHGKPTIIDVKKCRVGKGTREECEKAILNYGYHIQAAGYVRGIEKLLGVTPDFYWLFVEDNKPFDVQIRKAKAEDIAIGWHAMSSSVNAYVSAVRDNNLYGYVRPLDDGTLPDSHEGGLPLWYTKRFLEGMDGVGRNYSGGEEHESDSAEAGYGGG